MRFQIHRRKRREEEEDGVQPPRRNRKDPAPSKRNSFPRQHFQSKGFRRGWTKGITASASKRTSLSDPTRRSLMPVNGWVSRASSSAGGRAAVGRRGHGHRRSSNRGGGGARDTDPDYDRAFRPQRGGRPLTTGATAGVDRPGTPSPRRNRTRRPTPEKKCWNVKSGRATKGTHWTLRGAKKGFRNRLTHSRGEREGCGGNGDNVRKLEVVAFLGRRQTINGTCWISQCKGGYLQFNDCGVPWSRLLIR